MLIHGSDKERAFDLAVQRSFPYLIFPPIRDSYEGLDYDEFRNKLINNLVSLSHYKNSNDDVTFYKQNEEIRNMLESAVFDKTTAVEIESYKYQQMTVDRAIRDISTQLHDLTILRKELDKVKRRVLDIEKSKNVITPTNMFQKKMTALLNDEGEHTEKSDTVTDTVLKCLITSNKPMSIKQISESTGLTHNSCSCALHRVKTSYKNNIKITYKNESCSYGDKGEKRKLRISEYQWIENPEDNSTT